MKHLATAHCFDATGSFALEKYPPGRNIGSYRQIQAMPTGVYVPDSGADPDAAVVIQRDRPNPFGVRTVHVRVVFVSGSQACPVEDFV